MRSEFTPGAERALRVAAGWISCDESDDLGLPEVLLGLLAEPECRAALLLAGFHIDEAAVRRQFPKLRQLSAPRDCNARSFSNEWNACLDAAERLLEDYPRPLELATEHLLLGLVATENRVSSWLADCGLYSDALEAEVHRLSGHQPGPLPLDDLDEPLLVDPIEPTAAAPSEWIRVAATDTPAQEPAANGPSEQIAALRILDAAANRAGEGLRVIEDYLRFHLDDRHLTRLCKAIRHELAATLRIYGDRERHAARETQADVGTSVSLPAEQTRSNLAAVLSASFKRVEQSLRSLEEFSKTMSPETAATIEQLRYRVYTLEKVTGTTHHGIERLAGAQLYVLIDGGPSIDSFRGTVQSLIGAGVSVLQLRDKNLADRQLLERARLLRDISTGTETLFIMNDRPDVALLAGADGVHVGQDELTVKDARRILGPRGLVGLSTHSLEQARAAVLDGADYIGVGPTFPSHTKQFAEFTGPELLRAVAAEIRLPAFAIGGITAANVDQVLDAGFSRIAVSGAVTAAQDPATAARQLQARLIAG